MKKRNFTKKLMAAAMAAAMTLASFGDLTQSCVWAFSSSNMDEIWEYETWFHENTLGLDKAAKESEMVFRFPANTGVKEIQVKSTVYANRPTVTNSEHPDWAEEANSSNANANEHIEQGRVFCNLGNINFRYDEEGNIYLRMGWKDKLSEEFMRSIMGMNMSQASFKNGLITCDYTDEYIEFKILEKNASMLDANYYSNNHLVAKCGELSITVTPSDDTEVTIKDRPRYHGDVDWNGEVDASDALAVLKNVVRLEGMTLNDLEACDMNGNGEVDASDALSILKVVVALEEKSLIE